MSQKLTVQLSDRAYAALAQQAEAAGISPGDLAAAALERQFGDANGAKEDAPGVSELSQITPSNVQLRELAKKYPPPPEWFEGDEKRPF
jgi:hypothetical protein